MKIDLSTIYTDIGLTPRLIQSDSKRIPAALNALIPDPPKGFGLLGSIGAGKSSAVAVKLMLQIHREIQTNLTAAKAAWDAQDHETEKQYRQFLGNLNVPSSVRKYWLWVYWPDCYNWLQANVITEDKHVNPFSVKAMKTTRLLVLDDLGRDAGRIRDDAASYATRTLESVINHRNQNMLPTIWISNLEERPLIESLGMSVYSRLTEENPALPYVKLPNLRDM